MGAIVTYAGRKGHPLGISSIGDLTTNSGPAAPKADPEGVSEHLYARKTYPDEGREQNGERQQGPG